MKNKSNGGMFIVILIGIISLIATIVAVTIFGPQWQQAQADKAAAKKAADAAAFSESLQNAGAL